MPVCDFAAMNSKLQRWQQQQWNHTKEETEKSEMTPLSFEQTSELISR